MTSMKTWVNQVSNFPQRRNKDREVCGNSVIRTSRQLCNYDKSSKTKLSLTADPRVFQHVKALGAPPQKKPQVVPFRIDIPTRLMLLFTLRLTSCVWWRC